MSYFYEILGIASLFILRLGIPILIMAFVAYWLRRLDVRWQAEADALRQSKLGVFATELESAANPRARIPCWEMRNCSEEKRKNCPAYLQPGLPCWMVRRSAEGQLPTPCLSCQLFKLATTSAPQSVPSQSHT